MDNNSAILLPEVLISSGSSNLNNEYIEIMLKEDIPILCVHQNEQKERYVSFRALYGNNNRFWQLGGGWKYYLTEDDLAKIREKLTQKPAVWELSLNDHDSKQNQPALQAENYIPVQDYGSGYEIFASMDKAERIEHINKSRERLDNIISQKLKDSQIITGVLVETTRDAVQINRSTLLEAMSYSKDEAKSFTQDLVDSTCDMIRASVNLIKDDIMNHELMNILVEKSNGTTIQHMTKVYLNGMAFLAYYNKLVSQTSAISKFRISFASRYRDFYHSLLPDIDIENLNLERVFRKGMMAVSPELFSKWAVGFLIHDIGKAASVEYHEGENGYDRDIVVEHVRLGYNSVMNKTNFPEEASLIVGSHHEYYGDPDGYGYSRTFLEQYRANPGVKHNYCIAYEIESMLDHETIAYFPSKVLEIVDVYDSLTDPNRKYRKPMTSEEAIVVISEEFIKKRRKVDIILFDIFLGFIRRENAGQRFS